MFRALIAVLCACLALPANAKIGETVPQLVKRFGKRYTVEEGQLGKTYKFRSANVSLDAVVSNGRSICETYFSDHPLTASGEPPNDIVRAVLKTNAPKARWLEIDAATFRADYALRSSDGEFVAILSYTGPQPENMSWTMTVGLAKSVHAVSAASPSSNPSTPSPSGSTAGTKSPDEWGEQHEHAAAVSDFETGLKYYNGEGVEKNLAEAVKWFRKAAEQNEAAGQYGLAQCYLLGKGVPKDYVESYKWFLLASAQGDESASKEIPVLETSMLPQQIAEGQKLAREFKPQQGSGADSSGVGPTHAGPTSSGTGFFITEDGYLITSAHVVANAAKVRLVTTSGLISAKVVNVDEANDLALLIAKKNAFADLIPGGGKFEALPVAPSRAVKLGNTVVTVGFPNIGMQGFAPKFARGEIASLSGLQDDPRCFQISVPLQPGNSGGALVDEHGNVIGVVSAKLSAQAALEATGELPENVNYAVKSSFVLGFLESVPELAPKLKEPNTSAVELSEVVEKAKGATVLVLIY